MVDGLNSYAKTLVLYPWINLLSLPFFMHMHLVSMLSFYMLAFSSPSSSSFFFFFFFFFGGVCFNKKKKEK